jgi:hypothetical protein
MTAKDELPSLWIIILMILSNDLMILASTDWDTAFFDLFEQFFLPCLPSTTYVKEMSQ